MPSSVARSPEEFVDLLSSARVTVLNQTPTAFRNLLQVISKSTVSHPLSLRFIVFGGEALEMRSVLPWFERHGDLQPRLVNMYGITETTVHVTYKPLCMNDATSDRRSKVGIRIPDLQVLSWTRNCAQCLSAHSVNYTSAEEA